MLEFRDEISESDRQSIRDLVAETGMFRPNEVEVAVELLDDRLKRGDASDYQFVLSTEDERVVGYVCYGPITITLHSYDLYWIVVDRQHQGKGIGRLLLQEAQSRIAARGGRQIYVETSGITTYAPTRSFYERCGYEVEAVIRDFYAPGDDKWIYVRRLCPQS